MGIANFLEKRQLKINPSAMWKFSMTSTYTLHPQDLTASEIALILKHRLEKTQQDAALAFHNKAIATAHAFAMWSERCGEGLTFSTFINQFKYQEPDAKHMYDAVKRIQEAARPLINVTPAFQDNSTESLLNQESPYGAEHFMEWLRDYVTAGNASINTRNSFVHIVREGVFVLAPVIFKHYLHEHKLPDELHNKLSRHLGRLKLHIKNGDMNIHCYLVQVQDGFKNINGWVFPFAEIYDEHQPLPPVNNRLRKNTL